MMRKNVYLIVWLMTVILYSCYDDKGNYSYEDIDEISIAGMPDTLVTVFKNTDTLKVVPELKHTLAAGSGKYEYTWVAVAKENKTGNEFEYEIGKEKKTATTAVRGKSLRSSAQRRGRRQPDMFQRKHSIAAKRVQIVL